MYKNGKNMKHINDDQRNFKTLLIITGGVLLIAIVTFVITMNIYNGKVNEGTTEMLLSTGIGNLENNILAESASSSLGKTVNEAKNEINNATSENSINNAVNDFINNDSSNEVKETSNSNNIYIDMSMADSESSNKSSSVGTNASINENSTESEENVEESEEESENKKDISFVKPVEGEIIREFAKDNLVFSNTLDEWITHLGMDIKADKTTVVKAVASGTVDTIKNDPRYGLTVVIVHDNGFKSIYSNLLTAEFVTEGEEVETGQTIGTVGNNAAFEISDEPHLHFELVKDNEKVNPSIYIKELG